MNLVNKKDIIGKSLMILSVLTLIYIIYSSNFFNLDYTFVHIDEYFTLGFIRFPINELITFTANDVHPPLYYILLKVVTKLSYIANLTKFNMIFLRLVSLIPYLIILILSATKIKEEYGWLTAGILSFSLLAMTEYIDFYLLIRMYSWAILFMLLAFLSVKGILENNDKKSWALLTLFAILGSYTHYFVAISMIVLYISLFCYFLYTKNTSNIKLEILSSIIGVISYIPWTLILIDQLMRVKEEYWIEPLGFNDLLDCLSYYLVNIDSVIYLKVFSILLLIIVIGIIIKKYLEEPSDENIYLILGITTFLGTLLLGIIISFLFKPILIARYLIIPITALWLSLSIYIGQVEDEKILAISIALILIFASISIINFDSYNSKFDKSIEINGILDEMNKDNVTVICREHRALILFSPYLENCEMYSARKIVYGVDLEKINETVPVSYIDSNEISDMIDETNGTVYIIRRESNDLDLKDHEAKEIGNISAYHFYKILN